MNANGFRMLVVPQVLIKKPTKGDLLRLDFNGAYARKSAETAPQERTNSERSDYAERGSCQLL
jgi:hypothetical protein